MNKLSLFFATICLSVSSFAFECTQFGSHPPEGFRSVSVDDQGNLSMAFGESSFTVQAKDVSQKGGLISVRNAKVDVNAEGDVNSTIVSVSFIFDSYSQTGIIAGLKYDNIAMTPEKIFCENLKKKK